MSSDRSAFRDWTEYLASRTAVTALTAFDVKPSLRTAAAVGRLMHLLDGRHRLRAREHIAHSFADWPDHRVDQLVKSSFEHFVQLLIEIIHLPRMVNDDTWPDRLRLGNLGEAIELLNAGRPVILVTGHCGNWEALGYLLALLGYPLDAVARPLDNPLIYDWLLSIRQRRGLRVITKWDATDRMLQVLDSGGALGFIADQNAGAKGLFVPFFGWLASTYKSIGLLAINQNVPVICGYAHRISDRYEYEIGTTDIIYPEDWQKQRDPLYYVTARYVRAIEMMVRKAPEQYLWMHRRWRSRPRYERFGKPMPDALRRNLEELPWMDQATLEQLSQPHWAIDSPSDCIESFK